jgi:TonB family protein
MSALALSPGFAPGISFRTPVLPWTVSADDERRFRRILQRILAVVLLLAVGLPFVPLKPLDRTQPQALPPPIAKLLLERQPVPPTPQKRPEPAADAAPATPAPAADKPAAAKAPKKEAAVPEARNPVPGKAPGEVGVDGARRRASGVGLLAMKNELAAMTGAPLAVQLRQDILPGPGVGTGVGVGVGAGTEAGVPVRALITSNATNGSGGINTAAYSRDTGGGGLAGRATTLVEGVAGGGGGGGPGGGGSRAGAGAGGTGMGAGKGGTLTKATSGKASRSIEEIKLVFERNKGAIYALYNRALRDDPALQGKVVLELKIAPGGQVDAVRIVSSELKTEELERKLLARIRQFDFGAKDVEVMVVTWPVDFLPS